MKLSELWPSVNPAQDREITRVTSDSRAVEPGALFVAVRGSRFDGHTLVGEAVRKGAAAVFAEHPVDCGVPVFVVENTREAYGILSAAFWGNPSARMDLYGVTGTNGKTTISTLLCQLLTESGRLCGLIGTIENRIGAMTIPAKFTTPEPSELHPLFSRMEKAGCRCVSMEVSSMALDQRRLSGCRFKVGIFTNLTQDHLDYHGSMENYFDAKCRLFSLCENAVVNLDDPYGRALCERLPSSCRLYTFSASDPSADFFAEDVRLHPRGVDFTLRTSAGRYPAALSMPGQFAVENALAALGGAIAGGMNPADAAAHLRDCRGVRGRMEVLAPAPGVRDPGFTVICDYAHSDDSLEKAIGAVKSFASGKVWALFGPAGCRDRTKRPKMALAAARHADFVVLTSDNPRTEPPEQILDDAEPALRESGVPYKRIVDRYEAIRWVLGQAAPGDVVMLCGKGHENYQVLAGQTIYFDEHEIVRELLKAL